MLGITYLGEGEGVKNTNPTCNITRGSKSSKNRPLDFDVTLRPKIKVRDSHNPPQPQMSDL